MILMPLGRSLARHCLPRLGLHEMSVETDLILTRHPFFAMRLDSDLGQPIKLLALGTLLVDVFAAVPV